MEIVRDKAALRQCVSTWQGRGTPVAPRIAFVPTMGNLHAGHLALVERAGTLAERVAVSIFVNPLQFGEGEDFSSYPRTFEQDIAKLNGIHVDLVYAPAVEEVYPHDPVDATRIVVPGLSELLCGAIRPGHFSGVATVVAKLFNAVQPHIAVFGEKDYQQLLIIRRMVQDLDFPIEVAGVPTVRESDGLALSSRNSYLLPAEREVAPGLYRALCAARDRLLSGDRDIGAIEATARQSLERAGMRVDYVSVRDARTLAGPEEGASALVVLGAAWVGRTRLIDNVALNLPQY